MSLQYVDVLRRVRTRMILAYPFPSCDRWVIYPVTVGGHQGAATPRMRHGTSDLGGGAEPLDRKIKILQVQVKVVVYSSYSSGGRPRSRHLGSPQLTATPRPGSTVTPTLVVGVLPSPRWA